MQYLFASAILASLAGAQPVSPPAEEVKVEDLTIHHNTTSNIITSTSFTITNALAEGEQYSLKCETTEPVLPVKLIKCTGNGDTLPGSNVARNFYNVYNGNEEGEFTILLGHATSENTQRNADQVVTTTCKPDTVAESEVCVQDGTIVIGLYDA